MAAATDIRSSANKQAFWRKVKKDTNYQVAVPYDPQGIYAFDTGDVTVASTNVDDADDELFVLKFPDGTYLVNLQVTVSDLDTHGTPTLELNHIVENDAGTEVIVIAGASSTIAEAGGSAMMDTAGGHLLRDVGGMYLGFKVATDSATAAAGTVRYKGLIWMGAPITGI